MGDHARRELASGARAGAAPTGFGLPWQREWKLRETHDLLLRLSADSSLFDRYELGAEIGRGGMGVVVHAFDRDLRREVALKRIRADRFGSVRDGDVERYERILSLFVAEAQVTAQLAHPGVLPILDIGVDDGGDVYFTMPLVEGENLERAFDRVRNGEDGWNLPRAVRILQQVCETVAFAHTHGVVHRDLKPSNVMFGAFGAVYVLDWGLASLRSVPPTAATSSPIDSERSIAVARDPHSPLATRADERPGTPSYMAPEQVLEGRTSVSTDVFAVGAMLFRLLAGRVPNRGGFASAPPSIDAVAGDAPAELRAICRRAMAQRPEDRYGSMQELAADLRRFVEGRAVLAHATDPWTELRKWIARNRALSGAIAAALVAALVGGVTTWMQQAEAARRGDEVLRLSDFRDLESLTSEADALWPIRPASQAAYSAWLARAEAFLAGSGGRVGLEGHRQRLDRVRDQRRELPEDVVLAWWEDQLARLVAAMEAFADPATGCVASSARSREHGLGVARRLELAREMSVESAERARAWEACRADLADVARNPHYAGVELEAQHDLEPLRRDPTSGLWEFLHRPSGARPGIDASGSYVLDRDTGIVLVLIPGGRFLMGEQRESASRPGFDPLADDLSGPPHVVEVAPFFLSKYELTQGQWSAFFGTPPNLAAPGSEDAGGNVVGWTNPVESVSWTECERAVHRMGLALPTEAQWEYAARAGTTTTWWTGSDEASLEGSANVADQFAKRSQPVSAWIYASFDDGYVLHAPVGSYRANPFGLHDVAGNVLEWCRDHTVGYDSPARPGDGARTGEPVDGSRIFRGGCFLAHPSMARSAFRGKGSDDTQFESLGVRPSRPLALEEEGG